MATIQKRPGRLRRFFGWLVRHKVTAVFTVLILALGLYLLGSWVVLRAQIRAERERFVTARSSLATLLSGLELKVARADTSQIIDSCSYTSVEFGVGNRSCDIDIFAAYKTIDDADAKNLSQEITTYIQHRAVLSQEKTVNADVKNLATYQLDLNYPGLQCFVDYWYLEDGKMPFDVSGFTPMVPRGLLIQMNCGGAAKAEYFPVVK